MAVQILPKFDPGAEIGEAIGSGFSDAMKLLGERQIGIDALEKLKNIDTKNMSPQEIMTTVNQATIGLPHLQKQSSEMTQMLLQQKRADAMREAQMRGARGGINRAPNQQNMTSSSLSPQETSLSNGQAQSNVSQPVQPNGQGQFPQSPGMRDVPKIQDQTGSEPLLSREEIADIAEPFILTGDMAGMQGAINTARDQKLKQRDLQLQEAQALNKEMDIKRTLETNIAKNVEKRTNDLMDSKGINAGSEQLKRLSYKYFDDERLNPENRNKSDEQIWAESGRRLEQKLEDISVAQEKHYRPTWRFNKKDRAKSAQLWAQRHLESYGNTPEDREFLKSILVNSGWSDEESSGILQPLSKGVSSALASIPKVKPIPASLSLNQAAVQGIKREEDINQYIEEMAPKIRDSIGVNESLFVLKSKLVRDYGLNEDQAKRLMNKVIDPYIDENGQEQQLKLENHQIKDLSKLQEATKASLYDIIWGTRTPEILGPLI